MTTCWGNSCLFGLLYVSLVMLSSCVCASFPFGFEVGIFDLFLLVPDHCLSFYLRLGLKAVFLLRFIFQI